jgi:N-carbamoyl-L-amino-acid hydrolase
MSDGPANDAGRVVADLRELHALTGTDAGAQRVCWTETWRQAQSLIAERLGELGLEPERDEAGNVWAYLEGDAEPASRSARTSTRFRTGGGSTARSG